MTAPVAMPNGTQASAPRGSTLQLSKTTRNLPTRLGIHGLEGVGKTSMAAFAPKPVFLMVAKETGLETLIDGGQVPEVEHFPEPAETWVQVKNQTQSLLVMDHDRKTLVVDALGIAEKLLFDQVCSEKFGGDWVKFNQFGNGRDACLKEWDNWLAQLERLRSTKNMAIILLAHTRVKNFKNPEGPDYDRYVVDADDKIWAATFKWLDVVLFLSYETFVSEDKKFARPKGTGGQTRIINTERTAAYDAKNRLGLPKEIECGTTPQESWNNFAKAMQEAKKK